MLKFKRTFVALFVILALVNLATMLPPSNMQAQGPAAKPPSDVNVINTPNVNVVNTPNVNVANTVQVSEPVREAVNAGDQFEGSDGHSAGLLYTVPAGKQLIVTYVSALVAVGPGEKMLTVIRAVDAGGGSFFHYLKPVAVDESNFVAGEPVQFRLAAGSRLEAIADVIGFSNSNVGLRVNVSGYLVDVPQQ